MSLITRCSIVVFALVCLLAPAGAQQAPAPAPPATPPANPAPMQPGQTQPAQNQEPPDKRVFGVLPNYRTANETAVYTPIGAKQKFIIGAKDSFDYPLVLLAGAFAGLGQLSNQHPEFGQGLAGRRSSHRQHDDGVHLSLPAS
jgi:hypothetical protein